MSEMNEEDAIEQARMEGGIAQRDLMLRILRRIARAYKNEKGAQREELAVWRAVDELSTYELKDLNDVAQDD